MKDVQGESLCYDPIHGYIPFVSGQTGRDSEVAEREVIDHPWVQRLRQIHQLQTAWWVYPSAEHTRFQHVVGVMHLASRAVAELYDSLRQVCPDVPSRGYVECLLRMTGLLHDVGHGPFGHFFDEYYLKQFGLTHETLGVRIITRELGELLRGIRRNPNSRLEPGEELDPEQIAYLMVRPQKSDGPQSSERSPAPRWLQMLRSLLCGIYTIDNMDFVLRDAFMSGYSQRAYDLDRLLRYSFFSEDGLTIDRRGLDALVRFLRVRAELFRAIYFHRTVRAIDLTLADLFAASQGLLFSGNPLEHLEAYQQFTEWSLLVDVASWRADPDPAKRALAPAWQALLARQLAWRAVCERNLVFSADDRETASLFSDAASVEGRLRKRLPPALAKMPLRVDLPRHIHRPHARAAAAGQNFLYSAARGTTRPLDDDQLFRQLPIAGRTCRIYAQPPIDPIAAAALESALDELLGTGGADDLTNM